MEKIKNIYLSYWFNELKENPSSKVFELEDEIKSIIDEPIMYNEDNSHTNIIIPRIQGMSKDKKYLFSMSLINATLSINITNDISIDDTILLINNNFQLFFDIIKRVFDIKILFSSAKVEMIDLDKNNKNKLIKILNLSGNDYENLTMKQGFIKEDYYINYIMEYSKEYNFDFSNEGKALEEDLFNRSMVTSLSKAKLNKEYLLTIVEINDRYIYNKDANHETGKDDLRGMIMELKEILTKKLYWKL